METFNRKPGFNPPCVGCLQDRGPIVGHAWHSGILKALRVSNIMARTISPQKAHSPNCAHCTRACLITLHSNFEIFQKGHPAVDVMLDRRIFER